MYLPFAFAVASIANLAATIPLSARSVASFAPDSSWDILLNPGNSIGNIKEQVDSQTFQAIDIDLFDTDTSTIGTLRSTKQVICYFSAGSREDWRPDASKFTTGDTGKGLDGWPGETWVNISSANVRSIMTARIQLAASKGCTAVDPDNVDGYDENQDGFGYSTSAYVDYVKFLAQQASSNGLAMSLKNAIDLIPSVIDVVQFAVNEQCHEYGECDSYKPFTDAAKAVFNIEYGGNDCTSPAGVKLSTLIKPSSQSLSTLGGACAGQIQASPVNSGSVQSTVPAASKTSTAATHISTEGAVQATVSTATTPTHASTQSAAQPTPTNTDDEGEDPDDDDGDDDSDDDSDGGDNDDDSDGNDDNSDGDDDDGDEDNSATSTSVSAPTGRPSYHHKKHHSGKRVGGE